MRTSTFTIALLCLAIATPLAAEEGLLSRLNPFRQSSLSNDEPDATSTARAPGNGDEEPSESGFRLPSLPPPPRLPKPSLPALPKMSFPKLKTPQRSPAAANEPSSWQRLNSGTKAFFAKTRSTLMPWTNDKQPSRGRTRSGGSSSLLKSVFPSPAEEKPIETVNDYLDLPRPTY